MALSQNFQVNGNDDVVVSGNGVAGTPDAGVQTIQGISGATPVPISGTVTATNPSVGTTGTTAPTSATEIAGVVSASAPTVTAGNLAGLSITTTGAVRTDSSGTTQPISAASLPLPTGAATSANQATEITSLATIATNTTGVSTAANQTTGNTTLASLLSNVSPSTATTTDITLAITAGAVLASNAARKSYMIYNDSSLATMYVLEAASGATTTHFTYKILPQGSYESPAQCYTGAISYIASLASGLAHPTERV